MPCFSLPNIQFPLLPPIQLTIPLINAAVNAWASYEELQIYKDHRAKLNALAVRNMEIGRVAKAKNNEVEAKRALLYEQLCEEPQCEPCCDDIKYGVFTAMAVPMKRYQQRTEGLHYSQCGLKQSLLRDTLDELPRAIANTASAYNQEYRLCESVRQDYLRGVTSSAYRGEVPNPAILNELARNAADNLNDSSDLFSQFLSETTRSIGYEIGTRANFREATSAVGLGNNQFINGDVFNPQQNNFNQNQFAPPIQPFTIPQPISLGDDNA